MKKLSVLLFVIPFLIGPFLSSAHSGDLQLQVKDFECIEDNKLVVHYTIVNTFGFDYKNVSLGFKLVEDDKTITCKELKVDVPKEADGSQINDLVLNVPCSNKSFSIKSAIFYYVKRYKIEEWFSDCK
jgi:hypothetical protein